MFPEKNLISTDLGWVMQNPQVSDVELIRLLKDEFYGRLYRLAAFITVDPEKARDAVDYTLAETVSNRRRYWGNPSLRAWMYVMVLRRSQAPQHKKRLIPRLPFLRQRLGDLYVIVPAVSYKSLPTELQALGKGIAGLPPESLMMLYLHMIHDLTTAEIAYVLNRRESSILARLLEMRQEFGSQAHPGKRGLPEQGAATTEIHPGYRLRLVAALDRPGTEEDQYELKQHLLVCAGCRAYAADLALTDRQMVGCMQACWPAPEANGEIPGPMLADVGAYVSKASRRKKISRLAKEASLAFAAIAAVIVVSSIGNLPSVAPNSTPTSPYQMSVAGAGSSFGPSSDLATIQAPRRRGRFAPFAGRQPGSISGNQAANPSDGKILVFPTPNLNTSPTSAALGFHISGPVNLHWLLQFWNDQDNPEPYLQPNHQDETVMFYEMVNYIEEYTPLSAMMRMAGDIQSIKNLVNAGVPVLVEMGTDGSTSGGWDGLYAIVNGYDDTTWNLTLLQALLGENSDVHISYREFLHRWLAFNYAYMIVYPPEMARRVEEILGQQADVSHNYQAAVDQADADIANLTTSLDLFFAWFNKGTSLTYQEDYSGAKDAFDRAFSIYETLPEQERPWRMLWYQTRPYWAYFYTGNYGRVIDLATLTLKSEQQPSLEESYYWRALAREALGDINGAIQDLNRAIQINPNFVAGKYQLKRIQGG